MEKSPTTGDTSSVDETQPASPRDVVNDSNTTSGDDSDQGGRALTGKKTKRSASSGGPLKRNRSSAPEWNQFHLLDDDSAFTHECKICHKKLKVAKNSNGSWVLTNAKRHLTTVHSTDWLALKARAKGQLVSVRALFQKGTQKNRRKQAQALNQAFRQSVIDFYVYNKQNISKTTLCGERFADMLDACNAVPSSAWKRYTICPKTITKRVAQMYARWGVEVKIFIDRILQHTHGNPFGQMIHDTVTLKSGAKFLACGFSCVDPWLEKHHLIALGFLPVSSSAGGSVATALEDLCVKITGHSYKAIAHSTMSDYAALNVAQQFGHDKEGCSMHNLDKIARYAVGDLQHRRKGSVVEPFVDGQALMSKAQACVVSFSYHQRRSVLKAAGDLVEGGSPNIVPKTNICTTRVAARHRMIESVLLLNRAIRNLIRSSGGTAPWQSSGGTAPWQLTDEEWNALAEMEAIIRIVTTTTSLVQTETSQMGGMGVLLHEHLLRQLRGTEIQVLDLNRITATDRPLKTRLVSDLTPIGRACLKRAQLEAERRLCGSKELRVNDISGDPLKRSDRESMCLFLDPRTHILHCRRNWSYSDSLAAQKMIENEYIDFFMTVDRPHADLTSIDTDTETELCFASSDAASRPMTMDEWELKHTNFLRTQFKQNMIAYSRAVQDINWKEYATQQGFEGIPESADDLDPLMHLMNVDVLPKLRDLQAAHSRIVLMLTHSKACIASFPAASYAERINSAGGVVSHKGNICLDVMEISHKVPLRMNEDVRGVVVYRIKNGDLKEVEEVS